MKNNKVFDWCVKMVNEEIYGEIQWVIYEKEKYKEFNDAKEAQAWGLKYYSQWANTYKNVMQLAKNVVTTSLCTDTLECYCGYSHRQINQFLRNGVDNENHSYREMADILSMVLCSAPKIPCNLILYRMVNNAFIETLVSQNKQERPTPVQEKAFMSTSLLKSIANESEPYALENNLLKIYVEKGTIGVYVNSVTRRSEEEMLLFPNMYLALCSYPYKDRESGKTIFECKLIKFY